MLRSSWGGVRVLWLMLTFGLFSGPGSNSSDCDGGQRARCRRPDGDPQHDLPLRRRQRRPHRGQPERARCGRAGARPSGCARHPRNQRRRRDHPTAQRLGRSTRCRRPRQPAEGGLQLPGQLNPDLRRHLRLHLPCRNHQGRHARNHQRRLHDQRLRSPQACSVRDEPAGSVRVRQDCLLGHWHLGTKDLSVR